MFWRRHKIYTTADLPPWFWRAAEQQRQDSQRRLASNITADGWQAMRQAKPGTSLAKLYGEIGEYQPCLD